MRADLSDFEIHQYCMRHDTLAKHRLDSAALLDAGKCIQLQVLLAEKKAKVKGGGVVVRREEVDF